MLRQFTTSPTLSQDPKAYLQKQFNIKNLDKSLNNRSNHNNSVELHVIDTVSRRSNPNNQNQIQNQDQDQN